MADERRVRQRFHLNLQAKMTYGFDDAISGEQIVTVAANISSGGAFLTTDRPLPLASRVRVEFLLSLENLSQLKVVASIDALRRLAGGKQIWVEATGVVIRQDTDGVAVIFDQNYQLSPMRPADS